ncbi:unnamed protein product [Blepharisma stoltei]|uniref:Uncharacterized protein n=1 Tax=Blepharisma stoltei TaxID=1481888 RepID=A0AAU9K0R3_9CILI|nr:unnamed protein product [Blepharisma stoltei]
MDREIGNFSRFYTNEAEKERRKEILKKAEEDFLNAQKELEEWKTKRSKQTTPQPQSFPVDENICFTPNEFITFDNPRSAKTQVKLSISPIKEEKSRITYPGEFFESNDNYISKREHNKILQELAIEHNRELEAERSKGIEMFTKKAAEFEKMVQDNDRIKEIKYKQRHRSVEQLEQELLDLQTSVHQYKLNEEVMKKQYQALVQQSEKEIKAHLNSLAKAREEIEYYKIAKPQEIEKELNSVKERVDHLNCQIQYKEREIKEKDQQLLNLHTRIREREGFIAQLEQKIIALEQERLSSKEKEFEATTIKFNLEDEKRKREKIENDYNLLLKDTENIKQKIRKEIELSYREEIENLDNKNQKLKYELEKAMNEKNPNQLEDKKIQLENELSELENLRQLKLSDSTSEHIEGVKNYYEKRCKSFENEAISWKNKAGELVSKYYTALKGLRSKIHHFKAETIRKQAMMKDDFDDSINQIMGRYGKALKNADSMVQTLSQKLASLTEKKPKSKAVRKTNNI